MGSLTVPEAGIAYLDANSIIYRVERIEPYLSKLLPVFEAATQGRISLATSELSLVECLVAPIRKSDRDLEERFRSVLCRSLELRTIPISTDVLERAIQIRAKHGIRTPDAIHAATADHAKAAAFYTNDKAFHRIAGLPVQVLSECLD